MFKFIITEMPMVTPQTLTQNLLFFFFSSPFPGQWFPDGAECYWVHFQHHWNCSEQILLYLSLILLQPAVQLSQHFVLCCFNLGAYYCGHCSKFLCWFSTLRPKGLLLHLCPECQQFLHSGGSGGSLSGTHCRGHLLLSSHLGSCYSGEFHDSLHSYL